MRKTIAVIGLGRFGLELVKSLSELNVDVIALDVNEKNVVKVAQYTNHAFICDCTNEAALKEVGIKNVEHAVVAMGQNEENTLVSSIVATILLKNLGIKEITVRLDDNLYEDTLKKIGATTVISPLKIASERLATKIAATNFVDYFKLTDNYSVYEIMIPETMQAINLIDLDATKKFGINILLIKRDGKMFTPRPTDLVQANDLIFVLGNEKGANKLVNFLNNR